MHPESTLDAPATQAELQYIYESCFPDQRVPDISRLDELEMRRVTELLETVQRAAKGGRRERIFRDDDLASLRKKFPTEKNRDKGYVYFLQSELNPQYIKIGWTRQVASRLSELQVGNHSKLRVIYIAIGYQSKKTEFNIQKYFAKNHYRGEWFQFNKNELANIKTSLSGRLIKVMPLII